MATNGIASSPPPPPQLTKVALTVATPAASTPAGETAPASGAAQATAPELTHETPRSLVMANDIQLVHGLGDVELNKVIEVQVSRLASESTAAHHTADALLKNVFKLAEAVEGELSARINLTGAYLGAEGSPSLTVVGQMDAGAFNKLVRDVLSDQATPSKGAADDGAHQAQDSAKPQAWTLREKGTAFYNVTNSSYFVGLIGKVKVTAEKADQGDPAAKAKLEDYRQIVDIDRIKALKTAQAEPGSHSRGGLTLYPGHNQSGQVQTQNPAFYETRTQGKDGPVTRNAAALNDAKGGGSLSANQTEYRAVPSVKDEDNPDKPRGDLTDKGKVFTTAKQLQDEGRLTERELRVAQSSPRNQLTRTDYQFGATLTKFNADSHIDPDKTIVQRGNGFAVWKVKEHTGFDRDAKAHNKPTVAGPSGTTDRFMQASRLLGPGAKVTLGLLKEVPKDQDSPEAKKADHELKELTRWLATGYLVDDKHHSMVEVSLGAANHGLPAQWGVELYTAPFSQPIQAGKFAISSDQVLGALDTQKEVKVNRDYRRDLNAPLEWRENREAKADKVIFHGRGDIEVITPKMEAARKTEEAARRAANLEVHTWKPTDNGKAFKEEVKTAKDNKEPEVKTEPTPASPIPEAPPWLGLKV
jgi:hypothetical protein